MSGYNPWQIVLHDYGARPKGWKPGDPLGFNPYHAVISGGKIQYRYPDNKYGQSAPHNYLNNRDALSIAYAGDYGSMPDDVDLQLIREEIARQKAYLAERGIKDPKIWSHGEAYLATKGTNRQASAQGRDLQEASWRKLALDPNWQPASQATPQQIASTSPSSGTQPVTPYGGTQPVSDIPPVAQRGITMGHPNASVTQTPTQVASGDPGVARFANPNIGGTDYALYGTQTNPGTTQVASAPPPPVTATPKPETGAFGFKMPEISTASLGGAVGAFAQGLGGQDDKAAQQMMANMQSGDSNALREEEQRQYAALARMMSRYQRA